MFETCTYICSEIVHIVSTLPTHQSGPVRSKRNTHTMPGNYSQYMYYICCILYELLVELMYIISVSEISPTVSPLIVKYIYTPHISTIIKIPANFCLNCGYMFAQNLPAELRDILIGNG